MAIPLRALIVEDSEDDAELLVHYLRQNGFDPYHARVETGESMRASLEQEPWDVVFSDFTMPEFDAFQALSILKISNLDIPFIVVSGTIGEDRAVAAMQAGARDYILKGNLKRLAPAVRREVLESKNRRKAREEVIKPSDPSGYDPLMQSHNRMQFFDSVGNALDVARAANHKVAVVLCDVVGFKELSDTLGHVEGDSLLLETGLRIRGVLRPSDQVVRLDSGRFGILMGRVTAYHDTRIAADKIRRALEPPVMIGSLPINVEARAGIALYPAHGRNAEGLLERAAAALSRAKRAGLFQAVYEPDKDLNGSKRLEMLRDLMEALRRGDLRLQYQPEIDLFTGKARSLEALLRWHHALHGVIPPGEFIPAAERAGLIRHVTPWVLDTALRHCRAWQLGRPGLGVSVNVPGRSLRDPDFHNVVSAKLAECQVAPGLLTVEVTESALTDAPAYLVSNLERLAAMGVRISMDDFGTGRSSVRQLRNLPVDKVKIDGAFIANVAVSKGDEAIVRMLADMAHSLRMKVAAEGVVDAEVKRRLVKLGCDMAQGYYFGGPFPEKKLDDWFRQQEM